MKVTSLVGLLVLPALLGGCFGAATSTSMDDSDGGGAGTGDVPGTSSPPPVATEGDLPCDVLSALQSCTTCHGSPLAGGAPMALQTYADLIAPSQVDANALNIDRAIARMSDAQRPMPPGALPPQSDVDVLTAWRAQGMPPQTCSNTPPPLESVCSSGKYWTQGNDGSSSMNPGMACIACHSSDEGPSFIAAGTLFPTLREPDRCRGANGSTSFAGASVELIDDTGKEFSMTVNSSGNFYLSQGAATVKFPIRARVSFQGKTREMLTKQPSGDCNSCHTEDGKNGAPGRVALP